MKKNFALMGALTGLATVLAAAPALAADPIKLGISGDSTVVVGYSTNEQSAINGLGGGEFNAVDVKGDNTLTFSGETKLDSGLTVTASYSLEAGGRDNPSSDPADVYSISVGGAFGTIIAGADGTALSAIATGAPTKGGAVFAGLDEGDLVSGNWVAVPTGFGSASAFGSPIATYATEPGDSESLTYLSPAFYGFTFGATYVPDISQSDDNPAAPIGGAVDTYGVGLAYAGEFSGVSVAASGGWATLDATTGVEDVNLWQAGLTVGYNGFSVGGALKINDYAYTGANGDRTDYAWEIGGAYETGPYGVSLSYLTTTVDNGTNAGEDESHIVQLTGAYNMGPGVDLVAGLGYVVFDSALVRDRFSNEGVVVASGISLTF